MRSLVDNFQAASKGIELGEYESYHKYVILSTFEESIPSSGNIGHVTRIHGKLHFLSRGNNQLASGLWSNQSSH
ncbi:uncharacterized protein ZBIST_1878 [Zygosaccharomyces bailii]|nr:uncharacterized protein ZBIST_1878 [Zygosaccharomyces bailii]